MNRETLDKETQKMNRPPKSFGRNMCATLIACVAVLAACFAAAPAQADYEFTSFDVEFTNEDGTPATQAGSHPFAMTTTFEVANTETGFFQWQPDGAARDLFIEQVAGFIGNATAVPQCSDIDFATIIKKALGAQHTACPESTIVGINAAAVLAPIAWITVPVYNLTPPPGVPARLGFVVEGVPVTIDVAAKTSGDYNVLANLRNIPQVVKFFGSIAQLWGDPSDPGHDEVRGECGIQKLIPVTIDEVTFANGPFSEPSCPVEPLEKAFLTLPRSCEGPLATSYETDSWQEPGKWVSGSVLTHDDAEPTNPTGFSGCGKLGFDPQVEAKSTADSAETATGLDFDISFDSEGLESPEGIADTEIKKAVATLPQGVTINPSIGEGLGVCTPADIDREKLDTEPGKGCPNSSKIGNLHVETPVVDEGIDGSVFLAEQDDPTTSTPGAENPFDSLIAMYLVLRNEKLGAFVKLPAKVEPDEETGQLVTTVDGVPQIPVESFNFHFREGQRAPLVTPATCGTYTAEAELYPWSDPGNPRMLTSSFEITEGVGGGPCPPGGVPPFEPRFEAGSINNNAGSFSPFNMRLQRRDGDQDLTKFSSVLPPGVLGSLAGIEKCPDAAVAVAKAKTGRQEQASPSCPANSEIGSTLAGAGVGSALTYVPGKIFLAGPYKGAPLSVVSITPAVAGPFDAGTVAIRLGLDLNPVTAEVEVDGAASDPIPHILKGIVLKLRDLRVYVNRPNFTLNPTSCDESSAKARIFGSYIDVFDPADDVPVDLATRYQAANCLNLGFAPKLGLKLKGGTKRGNFPGLKAHYRPFAGHANVKDLVVRLPRSAFLEQGHIRTICTRVQFAADNCPKGAQYGYIRAWTPLLDEPLQGPVYLRSSNHKLPDLVFDLHGLVDVEVQTRIDSVRGGIRARVENAPDAPLSRVILNMQGGKKGLIVNSRNLCTKRKGRANAKFTGQNGKQFSRRPVLRPQCARKAKRSSHSRVSRVAGASKAG
ncbi:MAG TPA: hypothetical protein VFT19_12775 [Solirubrobacterales bacterium]|nr:hypothetical protein [Solirubrobacterales bacterium]